MPTVSIIIPNWNGEQFLKHCLPSLEKQTYKNFEVIIIDNGSVDNSVDYIKKNFQKYKVIALKENTGFSPAVNLGIKKAKGDYIFLLNNDTKVETNCLSSLVKTFKQKKEYGMVAAKMVNFYDPTLIDSAGDYIEVSGHADNIGQGEKDGPKYNKESEVFLVTGGGSLIRKEVFEKIGLLDEDYFAYFEDVDFCLRAQLQGIKSYYQPKAKIYHIHKATSRRNPGFLEYLQFRNMTQTIIKDFPSGLLKKDFNWLLIVLVNVNTVRYLMTKGHTTAALKAEWYIIKNFKKLLEKRKEIQSKKIVPDEYITKNFRKKKFNNILMKKIFN